MTLKEYREKRDFRKTAEPRAATASKKRPGLVYVIQKHRASHLHYDLRLEEKGVLKSWALPKEPPSEEGVRRLAVQTEDHPLDYADFEGEIPEGEYGAGRVVIWDRGTYRVEETAPGKRIVVIQGRLLSGRYGLVKLKPKKPEDKNWLFFKLKSPL
ncbi:MAG: 3'-phosphoesterase [Candidatus Aminicenantes bacterium]|nr:3'-phosphoesterase [Candidatus Aminicenantes bacterium]